MNVVLKNVSVDCLFTLKLYLEGMIHDIELTIPSIENDFNTSSKYSKDFYRDFLKNKKAILSDLRN